MLPWRACHRGGKSWAYRPDRRTPAAAGTGPWAAVAAFLRGRTAPTRVHRQVKRVSARLVQRALHPPQALPCSAARRVVPRQILASGRPSASPVRVHTAFVVAAVWASSPARGTTFLALVARRTGRPSAPGPAALAASGSSAEPCHPDHVGAPAFPATPRGSAGRSVQGPPSVAALGKTGDCSGRWRTLAVLSDQRANGALDTVQGVRYARRRGSGDRFHRRKEEGACTQTPASEAGKPKP